LTQIFFLQDEDFITFLL